VWSYSIHKVILEVIPDLVIEGNELVDLPGLRKKLQDLEKKIEVEQRILSGAQKMAAGNVNNKQIVSMRSASLESADNISDLKNQHRSIQRQLEIAEASYGVWLRYPDESSCKVVFSAGQSREGSPFSLSLSLTKADSLSLLSLLC